MSTDNETWRENSTEGQDAGRDGNRSFNRDGNYNREGHYNREGADRPYRPSYNKYGSDRPQRPYNREGGDRPRFNREDRPQRSFNREDGSERPYRPRVNREGNSTDRPYRPYNREGGDRNYNREGGDRPYRPSYNNNRERNFNREDRPWHNNSGEGNSDRPRFQRPNTNYGGNSYNREGGDRPRRPRINSGGGSYGQGFSRPVRRTADYDPNAKYSRKKQIEYKEQFVDPNEPIRLNKFLANAGVCSRREADEFITAGVVSVNGEVVTELGTKIKRSDVVKFHDEPVSIERKVYVLLNKPKDCVTTSDDPQERRTVMDFVKGACNERIYPVGRLDRNTTGVLLLTNDGDLASKLTHPKYLKKKIYHVYLDKNLTKADMDQIAAGVQLEDGEIHADTISYASDTDKAQVGIEIHSGKNRIVRRIFESLGYKVMKLDRVFFAGLTKKNLRRGEWRYLTEQEVNFLRMGSFE
ncbi:MULTISPECIES: pseudouridine synthase [unclassified Bacteroides]|jgi:23S rRNA pseudouridine2605 synthase|uniref:pseudouridine synthase n=1 Tax=unclassified Bacteroides TaxID=2646097 RepID=UPI000E8A6C31|nr:MULTISPECIES: pseudouridine synthase [unclassified Bacteroides]RGN46040.1 pseudouridine synthase [Bacteroides sp. OM05-12]RHR74028.1 pseudouridine synthase [Bacteroides sp. AF16-49]